LPIIKYCRGTTTSPLLGSGRGESVLGKINFSVRVAKEHEGDRAVLLVRSFVL